MIDNFASWNGGLLLAVFSISFGMIGFVAARNALDRSLSAGLLAQGILLCFVTAASFHHSQSLRLGGLIILGFLILKGLTGSTPLPDSESKRQDDDTC